jgi:hypothetical protein
MTNKTHYSILILEKGKKPNAIISVSGVIIIGLLVRAAWRQME